MVVSTRSVARMLALATLLMFVAVAPASAVSATTYEKQVLAATNEYRAHQGRVAVKFQKCVDGWANGQAKWMAKHKVLAHREGRLRKVLKDCKLSGTSENIGWNFSSGDKIVAAWAGSAGHAKNMSASNMRYIGVGVARASNGDIYVAQIFGTRR